MVFFGRFVTGLRTWGAFLAGANRMRPTRFLCFSTLSAFVWAAVNGLQYYFFGHLLDLVGTALGVLLLLAGIGIADRGRHVLRRRGRSIEQAAELALPGPLDVAGPWGAQRATTSSISKPSCQPVPPASRSYARITPTRRNPTFSYERIAATLSAAGSIVNR